MNFRLIYKQLTAYFVLAFLLVQCKPDDLSVPRPVPFERSFFIYNFGGLEAFSPEDQVSLLSDYGYNGITFPVKSIEDFALLKRYSDESEKNDGFAVHSVFFRYIFNYPDSSLQLCKNTIDQITGTSIQLWFIFGRPIDGLEDSEVESILREVVNYASDRGVEVMLYPHTNTYFYTAEQALPLLQKIDHPNLKVLVHSCHELIAGNGHRLDEVVENVQQYLGGVTIAGAEQEVDLTTIETMNRTTIKPLEDGSYDLSPFLEALNRVGYTGAVGFINFRIEKSPDDYLPNSLGRWKLLEREHLMLFSQ